MKNLLAKKVKKNNKGFTLVELIIVIAIIAILVAVLAPNYIRYVDRSRWSSDQSDCETLLSEVKNAVIDVQNEGGSIPNNFKVTVNGTNTRITHDCASEPKVKSKLDEIDSNWDKLKVRHKNKQKLGTDSDAKTYTSYEITMNSSGEAVGEWKPGTK